MGARWDARRRRVVDIARAQRYCNGQPDTKGAPAMGINTPSEIEANLQVGPTDQGMVRIYLVGNGVDLPLDFDPEEAEEIAEELRAAAAQARKITESAKGRRR